MLLRRRFTSVFAEKRTSKKFSGPLLFLGFFFEFIQAYNGGWAIPRPTIPYSIFGISAVDDILAFVIMAFFTIVFYEHFIDDEKDRRISGKSKEIFWLTIIGCVFVI